jgi:hypothetical protein
MRQLAAAIALSALAIAATLGLIGPAGAADLLPGYAPEPAPYAGSCPPRETVQLYKEHGLVPKFRVPTPPARTPYYTCVTGGVLVQGDIPPPPEYCCG